MSKNNKEHPQKPLKALDKASKIGKIAFKIAFGANIVGLFGFILASFRIFSLYAIITIAICLAISFIGYTVLLFDIMKFNQINKSTH